MNKLATRAKAQLQKKTGKKGFTLVEVIVVLVILAILAALPNATASWSMQTSRSP